MRGAAGVPTLGGVYAMEGRVDTVAADLLGGRYELGKPLGSGGMADVYAARDRVLGRDVAIKFFRPLDEDADRARFVAEARMLARLCHPGLVTVYDAHLDGRRPCLIMQLVGGGTLRRHISTTGPLPSDDVAALGARLADALDHVHANDIVHRDIKPSNVLIDSRGTYYLADFGLAWALGSIHLTNPGEMVGTTCYLAPEQVTGTDVGPAADIYALGLVLLECLTGRTEYAGTDVESAIARLQRPPSVPTTLGPAWQKLLAAMTRYHPGNRPDASTCARLLWTIAHDGPLALPAGDIDPPTTRVDAPKTGRRAASRSRRLHAGLGAAGAAGAVLTALMLGTPTSTDGDPAPGDRAPEEPPPPPTRVHEPPPRYHNDEPATPHVPPAAPPPRTGAMQTGVTQPGEAAPPEDDGRKAGKAPAGKGAPGRQGAKPGNAG
jgi:eukaryotic-like serine/threonine-protein kinase